MRTLILSILFCLITGFVFSQNLDSTNTLAVSDSSDHNFTKSGNGSFQASVQIQSIPVSFSTELLTG